jgi:hypothetical protein
MFFLIFFGLIVFIIIGLNSYNNTNLDKIQKHFEATKCQNIIYSKGTYKAICEDKVMQIDNNFSIDLKKDEKSIKLSEINEISKNNLTIVLNDSYMIAFKDKNNLEVFYKDLRGIINK